MTIKEKVFRTFVYLTMAVLAILTSAKTHDEIATIGAGFFIFFAIFVWVGVNTKIGN